MIGQPQAIGLLYPVGVGTDNYVHANDMLQNGPLELLPNGKTIYSVAINLGAGSVINSTPAFTVWQDAGGGNFTLRFRQIVGTIPTIGGTTVYPMSPTYTVPGSGNFYLGWQTRTDDTYYAFDNGVTGRDDGGVYPTIYSIGNTTVVGTTVAFSSLIGTFPTWAPYMR